MAAQKLRLFQSQRIENLSVDSVATIGIGLAPIHNSFSLGRIKSTQAISQQVDQKEDLGLEAQVAVDRADLLIEFHGLDGEPLCIVHAAQPH
jgi:hypothetical protein